MNLAGLHIPLLGAILRNAIDQGRTWGVRVLRTWGPRPDVHRWACPPAEVRGQNKAGACLCMALYTEYVYIYVIHAISILSIICYQ